MRVHSSDACFALALVLLSQGFPITFYNVRARARCVALKNVLNIPLMPLYDPVQQVYITKATMSNNACISNAIDQIMKFISMQT